MAMSPRLLRPSASGFTPRSITGLALWLDASDASTLFQDAAATTPATATSDPVGAWLDKSGNARHATQSTAAGSRPTRGGAIQNNRSSVAFAGSPAQFMGTVVPGADAGLFTVFAVARSQMPAGSSGVVLGERGGNFSTAIHFQQTPNKATVYIVGNTEQLFAAHGGVASIYSITKNSTSQLIGHRNAAQEITQALSSSSGYNLANLLRNIGASTSGASPLYGNVYELIAYGSALSASDRLRIERYLAAKWGITLAPQVSNADAQDWVNRVYANGGTVSSSTAAAVSTFCDAIDAASIRNRFYRLNLFCGGTSGTTAGLAACLVPLYRGPSLGGTQYGSGTDANVGPFVVGDYAENAGLTGNGSSKYLDTGFPMNTLPSTTSGHAAVYCRNRSSSSAFCGMVGVNLAAGNGFGIATDGTVYAEWGAFANITNNQNGLLVSSRTSATSLVAYAAGTTIATNSTSTTPTASTLNAVVFASRNSTVSHTFFDARTYGFYSIGTGLSAGDVSALTSAVNAFQSALGRA